MKIPGTHSFLTAAAAVTAVIVFAGAVPQLAAAQNWYDATTIFGATHFNLISDSDRVTLRNYVVNEHERQCGQNETPNPRSFEQEPCGVASHIVRYYQAGTILPDWVSDTAIPTQVVSTVTPPPPGAAYVYAQDAVYMIDVQSRRILDLVTLPTS